MPWEMKVWWMKWWWNHQRNQRRLVSKLILHISLINYLIYNDLQWVSRSAEIYTNAKIYLLYSLCLITFKCILKLLKFASSALFQRVSQQTCSPNCYRMHACWANHLRGVSRCTERVINLSGKWKPLRRFSLIALPRWGKAQQSDAISVW